MNRKILVKVLKSDDQFDVICKPTENFGNFKKWCKKFVKVPVDEFSIICNGKVIEGNKRLSELGMFEVKNVYLYVISVKEEIKKLSSEEKMRKALIQAKPEVFPTSNIGGAAIDNYANKLDSLA